MYFCSAILITFPLPPLVQGLNLSTKIVAFYSGADNGSAASFYLCTFGALFLHFYFTINSAHTHNNQSALDEITAERIEKWDNAPEYVDNQIKNFKTEIHGNLHQHKNLAVLDSITAESVAEWNNCVEMLSGVETILAKIVEVDT